ncbi:hypothetical protein AOH254_12590 [Helicobacter pylori]
MDLNDFNRYQSMKKEKREIKKRDPNPLQSKGGFILPRPLYLN